MQTMQIFVYGTLKQSQPNAAMMDKVNAKLVGMGRTVESYPLIIGTDFNIPAILNIPGF